ncbi:hypothetical protein X777_06999 [Ooceraea biroi]|uniref:Uncharacterized protein n=1 Tax=Ooceraea biroi TaxID=2015173 RepID=A0A026WBV5_OOCBI|nr:hypothetical protein X777_06999 [Ooceraea biroi]
MLVNPKCKQISGLYHIELMLSTHCKCKKNLGHGTKYKKYDEMHELQGQDVSNCSIRAKS